MKSYRNGAHCLTNKFMVRETINKRKNAEAQVKRINVRIGEISKRNRKKHKSRPDKPNLSKKSYILRIGA